VLQLICERCFFGQCVGFEGRQANGLDRELPICGDSIGDSSGFRERLAVLPPWKAGEDEELVSRGARPV
jgi:hypothetical protein